MNYIFNKAHYTLRKVNHARRDSYHIHLLVMVLAVRALSPRHEWVEAQQKQHVEEQQAYDTDDDNHYYL